MKKGLTLAAAAMTLAAWTATASAGNYSIGHPFYTPDKDGRVVTAGLNYSACKYDREPADDASILAAGAVLNYGASDKVVLAAEMSRKWNRYHETGYDNDLQHANIWGVGGRYKFIDNGRTFLSAFAGYEQTHVAKSVSYPSSITRFYTVNATYGRTYKTVTPYLDVTYENALDQGRNNDGWIGVEANVYKQFNKKLGGLLGVGYMHETDVYSTKLTYAQLKFSYAFTDKCALELGGKIKLSDKQEDVYFGGVAYNFEGKSKYILSCKVKFAF